MVEERKKERKRTQMAPLRKPSETRLSRGSNPLPGSGSSQRGLRSSTSEDNNETIQLNLQIEEEERYRDTILWSVGVLKTSVEDLESQYEQLQKDQGFSDIDAEFKSRTKTQLNVNKKYEEQIEWYEKELDYMMQRLDKGLEISYDDDLDQYSEIELQHMVQALERERNILSSELKTNGWLLDSHSKQYYNHKEVAEAYQSDLNFVNRSLEDFWRQFNLRNPINRRSSNYTPVTSPGSLNWSNSSGILPSQRIIDPRKGPIKKIAGVRSLPRLDTTEIDAHELAIKNRQARSKLRGVKLTKRATSLDSRKKTRDRQRRFDSRRHHSMVETRATESSFGSSKETNSKNTDAEDENSTKGLSTDRSSSIRFVDDNDYFDPINNDDLKLESAGGYRSE